MDADTITTIRIVAGLLFFPFVIVPFWKIFSKAGFSRWLALLMVVPGVNFIVLYFVAFQEWKPRVPVGAAGDYKPIAQSVSK